MNIELPFSIEAIESQTADTTLVNTYEYELTDNPPEGFGFIYCITNMINGKQYIGQTLNSVSKRFHSGHCSIRSGCLAISSAIKKYGRHNFTITILGVYLKEILDEAEYEAVREYGTIAPNGYNLKDGGRQVRLSEESRAKMSLSQTGKKQSPETVAKRVSKLKGQKRDTAVRKRMSDATKGKKKSDGHKKKLSEALTGINNWNYKRSPSAETRKKLSIANKGKTPWIKGKKREPFSKETRKKMSNAKKGIQWLKTDIEKRAESCRITWAKKKNQNIAGQLVTKATNCDATDQSKLSSEPCTSQD